MGIDAQGPGQGRPLTVVDPQPVTLGQNFRGVAVKCGKTGVAYGVQRQRNDREKSGGGTEPGASRSRPFPFWTKF